MSAFDIRDSQQRFESDKNVILSDLMSGVDGALSRQNLPDPALISEVIDELFRSYWSELQDLADEYYLASTTDTFSQAAAWNTYVQESIALDMRRVQKALLLALDAEAELETMRMVYPLIRSIVSEYDYMSRGLASVRKSLSHFEAHYSCYCSSCNAN